MSVIKHKNLKKLKLFFLAFIVISLAAVIAVFINYRRILENPEKLISSFPVDSNLSIGKIHQTSTKNGVKEFSLEVKDMMKAQDRRKNSVGRYRGNNAGDQGIGFKVFFVEDFNSGQGPAQGGAKNGAESTGRPGQ